MTMFMNQLLGCLIIAAGIGGAVGWLLKQVSVGKGAHLLADVTAMMHLKEQMLEKARQELRASASEMKELESQIGASEALHQSNQEELALRQMRIQTLQEKLTAAKQQLSTVGAGQTTLQARLSENEARSLAQAEEARLSKAALEAAQQKSALQEQELRSLQEHLQALKSQIGALEALRQSNQEELVLRHQHIQTLQEELTAANQQRSTMEAGQATLRTRLSEIEARTIAQGNEIRQSQAALETAQQGLVLKEQELRSLHERLGILESQCADTDRLRARVQELEPAQGRVLWLEGQLSERNTQHRAALDEVELQLAERDRRIRELEQIQQMLKLQAEGHESPPIEKAA